MTQMLESSLVRIFNTANQPVGVGFLVAEGLVLTCAHVIAASQGQRAIPQQAVQQNILLDFPLLLAGQIKTGKTIFWDAEKDVAGLTIEGAPPPGAQPLSLVYSADLWGHPLRAFGFPQGFPNGVWAQGRTLSCDSSGWLQIEDTRQAGYFVQPGFSGGAVWDETLEGVSGMVVAADTREGVRTAFVLPTRLLVEVWPRLQERVVEAPRIYYPTASHAPQLAGGGRRRIFLSYKRGVQPDEELALYLYQELSKLHEVFIDQQMPVGAPWRERIQAELEGCDFLIPLLSDHSAHSEMVSYEISTAHHLGAARQGKPAILPVRVAYAQPFDYPLSAYLNHLNWAAWSTRADSARLAHELLTAINGGQLSLVDMQAKSSALPAQSITRPTASADPARLERPGGTMDGESRFYIERPGDAICQREMARPGSTIVIKAARQMGKSSLLVRAAGQAAGLGRRVVFLDFQLLDETMLASPERFFQGFCRWIADELDLDEDVERAWSGGLGHVQSCTKFMRRAVLKAIDCPLTLALDEVDRMLDCSFRSDFFGMLRSWHNSRLGGSEWRKLDLLLVISTEPYLLIEDLKQSPFNVGEVIRLDDFDLAQVMELNARHGAPFSPGQVERLFALLGGQPYLVRQALYRVACAEMGAEALFQSAAQENGPFGDHLRRHIARFSQHPALARAMRQVVTLHACPDEMLYNRLHAAGLALRQDSQVVPRCALYAEYFKERLVDA